jgi:hypothetical protein
MAKDTIVFPPFTNNLRLKRILSRVKVGPQLLNAYWLLSNRGLTHDQRKKREYQKSTHGDSFVINGSRAKVEVTKAATVFMTN